MFCNTFKPFLIPKSFNHDEIISIEINNQIIKDVIELAKQFNSYHIIIDNGQKKGQLANIHQS